MTGVTSGETWKYDGKGIFSCEKSTRHQGNSFKWNGVWVESVGEGYDRPLFFHVNWDEKNFKYSYNTEIFNYKWDGSSFTYKNSTWKWNGSSLTTSEANAKESNSDSEWKVTGSIPPVLVLLAAVLVPAKCRTFTENYFSN